jgi:hypothetical protein
MKAKHKMTQWSKLGVPGQQEAEMVFCPIFNRWINNIVCFEITQARALYDDLLHCNEENPDTYPPFIRTIVLNSGRVFPEQLGEVVRICQFCEKHCLGRGCKEKYFMDGVSKRKNA